MAENLPRIVIAGLSGDSGKTVATLSIVIAMKRRGLQTSVFKKGPDYIDPAWLSWASGSDCRNLDTFMIGTDGVAEIFRRWSKESAISVIEGNRGIFDGKGEDGIHSTAELAKLLRAPVVLVVDCAKTTRTIAAMIKGCIDFDPELNIVGVILNKLGGERHRKVIAASIEKYCCLPALGAISRLADDSALIPGRHLGLVTPAEFENNIRLESDLGDLAEKYLDINEIIKIARNAEPLESIKLSPKDKADPTVRIGYFKDSVFTFYYPENLEALGNSGAELIAISSIADKSLPDIDGLYIGGGFPETHTRQLSENRSLMESVRSAAEAGLPIYAECGGLIYLAKSLKWNDRVSAMAGVFDLELEMSSRPRGHGYTIATIDKTNPFFKTGAVIRGHEFHYSGPVGTIGKQPTCMKIETGSGLGNKRDGLFYNNCFAAYTHIHAEGVGEWAGSFVRLAFLYKTGGKNRGVSNSNYVGISL
jgi:cobyrinic acid a,c-diamide synthase